MKILICENEEILLTALEFRLRKNGYDLTWASNGIEALEKSKAEAPDLIISSLNLPELDGLELVKKIRFEENNETPMIVIGELEQSDVITEALRCGVNDFLTKPFKPVELVLRVNHILSAVKENT